MMPKKKQIKEYGLRSAVSEIPQDQISSELWPIPFPFSPIDKITEQVISRLSEIPIFLKSGKNFYIRDPEESQIRFTTVKVEYEGRLFRALASKLIRHYKNIQIDHEICSPERGTAFLHTLGDLCSWKKELIASGFFNEKSFKKTIERFALGWTKYMEEYLNKSLLPNQRAQLVKDLYECFSKFVPELRTKTNARFYCIAYILKGFNLEEGTEEQIFGRIKVYDYHYRKR